MHMNTIMTIYFLVLTFCIVIKTYVIGFTINNFNPINITDLKRLVGQDADKFLLPMLQKQWRGPEKQDEASEEKQAPPPAVFRDEKKNVFFDVWVVRGRENRLMSDNRGQLCVSVLSSPDVHDALNSELWRFFSNLLRVRRDEIEIIVSETNDMARRVLVKGRALTDVECQQRLAAYRQPFTLEALEEGGAEESAKLDELFFHAEVKAKSPSGPPPEMSAEDAAGDWSPNYVKNPTMLDRVLRDLMPNQEIIVRGRLLKKSSPNFVARPLLEDYQGQKTLKVRRKILEGVHDRETARTAAFPSAARMSCPDRIPGLSVIDTLSQDGSRVLSRRVLAPLFQNKTHDFIDELDYVEVQYKSSI